MTRQTTQPLASYGISPSARRARGLYESWQDGDVDLNPPYQRGSEWTEDQRVALIRSFLTGIPIPAIILNDRKPVYAVVDGKQRIETIIRWFDGDLDVPASWFEPSWVETVTDTEDGPYVNYRQLTAAGRANFSGLALLPVAEAVVPTIRQEAEVYLLVNGAGTPQTDEDLANAAQVAGEG